jgi:hypothetical protein
MAPTTLAAMGRSQRMAFLGVGALIAVVAVVLIASGGGSTSIAQRTTSVPLLTPGTVRKLTYTQGQEVRFRVRTKSDDEVHVHGYDIEKELKGGRPQTIAFKATINGIFEIELHHANVQIARLTVEPK